ncbi:MAG: hypothetical protein AYK23_04870 [Candidatus Proteinoplasmatales archaeon SG8-5]|nr:MAG: hypothetical protein AYK23_04870 [Candidatus Proteinoplasmatales archaeon SG8-5]
MAATAAFLGVAMAQMMQSPDLTPINRPPPLPGRTPCISEPLPVCEDPNPKTGPDGVPVDADTGDWSNPKSVEGPHTDHYRAKGSGFHCGAFHS